MIFSRITHFGRGCVLGALHLLLMTNSFAPSCLVVAAVFCDVLVTPPAAAAAETQRKHYDIGGGDAAGTLKRMADESGRQIVFLVDVVRGVKTNPVKGEYTAREALDRMVANTRLVVAEDEKTGALMINRTALPSEPAKSTSKPSTAAEELSKPTIKRKNLIAVLSGLLALTLAPAHPAHAADGSSATAQQTAAITGRVQNVVTGQYLNNARISIRGTDLVAFTDQTGTYRLNHVPTSPIVLEIFYTGLDPQQIPLQVPANQTREENVNLTSVARYGVNAEVVKLDSFVVSASKEIEGAAIAINEQRFAANIKSVIAADEFGPVVNGNIGELMKFLPGITIDFIGGDARAVSLNGAGAAMTPVMVNGFSLASAPRGTGRDVELISVATNNIARVEISQSPTPESPGGALAGSVNFVPQSAFDRATPLFTAKAYLLMRGNEPSNHRIPEPGNHSISYINPGVDFSYIAPVNSHFGYTLTGARSTQYQSSRSTQLNRIGAGFASNGTTLPDTTPDNPYLTGYNVQDFPKQSTRSSLGMTLDYKFSPADQISFSVQGVFFEGRYSGHFLQVNVGSVLPGNFSTLYTHGAVGKGEIQLQGQAYVRHDTSYLPSLVYRHNGLLWKAEAGLGYSRSTYDARSIDEKHFYGTLARRTGVTVSFDDNSFLRPGKITVTDGATGASVDPYNINSYSIASVQGIVIANKAAQGGAYGNLRRDFFGRVPFSLKTGFDLRKQMSDTQRIQPPANFVGADGIASSTPATAGSDDGAGIVLDDSFSQRVAPYVNVPIQWTSGEKLWNLYEAHPSYFQTDENTAYRNIVGNSKHAEEVISSVYLRGDLQMFDNRLKLVGGLRAEQTNVTADGPLTDLTLNYQRDANGNVLRGSNGVPLKITTDALQTSKLTYLERRQHARKEYLRLFPSINASYNFRSNLVARAAYYYSVGRPNFNQYAGGITLPDTTSAPSTSNRITVNNAGIKAWSAKSTKVSLEYYFKNVGVFSIGAYRRDFTNFFGSIVTDATPELLALYGLDPSLYTPYQVSTQYNLPSPVRMEGLEFNYKQALTFLPDWARGVQVFANATVQRASGEQAANFSGFIPQTYNWGISLNRPKYNVRANWNYVSRARAGLLTGRSIEPNSYQWTSKRLLVDLSAEYSFSKSIGAYITVGNLTDETQDYERAGPHTPVNSQFYFRDWFGALWTVGVKSTF